MGPVRKPGPLTVLCGVVVLASSLGCLRFPSQTAYQALDYKLDRERVIGVRLDPPVLAHGLPVHVEALVVGPSKVESVRADLCGLRDDVPSQVGDVACYQNEDLVSPVGAVPLDWDPPDLTTMTCPQYDSGWWDTGVVPHGDSGGAEDTGSRDSGDTGESPYWSPGECDSMVPMLVTAETDDGPAYGMVEAVLRKDAYVPGEYVPPSYADVPHTLTVTGDPVAGGTVDLEFEIDAPPDPDGFRWYVTDGELRGTGRTAPWPVDDTAAVRTTNTLTIPEKFSGPLDVYVVARSQTAASWGYTGDVMWDHVVLEVP